MLCLLTLFVVDQFEPQRHSPASGSQFPHPLSAGFIHLRRYSGKQTPTIRQIASWLMAELSDLNILWRV
jgi:hypothetical protein